ncbi:MAG: hypothetical protein ACOC44_16955 [Promethearchaeia archaeon]
MSLDKWLKPDEEEEEKETEEPEEKKKEKPPKREGKTEGEKITKLVEKTQEKNKKQEATSQTSPKKNFSFTKFKLKCGNCKYEKTLVKRKLSDKDKTCPRCNDALKIRKL